MRFYLMPCPCQHPTCHKVNVAPIFYGQESSIDVETAQAIVDRWNAFEELSETVAKSTEVIVAKLLKQIFPNPPPEKS